MKQTVRLFINYFLLIILFTSCICLVYLIPTKAINTNVSKSAEVIIKEGLYKEILNFKLFKLDNYTDALMLNIAVSADNERPITSAMLNNYYNSSDGLGIAKDTKALANGNKTGLLSDSYGRYWHGYLCTLKPILCIFNYNQIRIINYICLFSLIILISILINKKIGRREMFFFLLSLILINFPIVPLSLQFSTMFYIAFVASLILLLNNDSIKKRGLFLCYFFTIGGFTSFMDFLTTPLISLGIPLTIFLLLNIERTNTLTVIKSSISWFMGYSSIWVSKWAIGWLLTGTNIYTSASEAATLRTSNLYNGMEMTIPNIITFIFEGLQSRGLLWPLVIVGLFSIGLYLFMIKDNFVFVKYFPFLLVTLMFPFWFLILRNHTITHARFTWRTIVIMIFSLLIFIYNTTDIGKIKRILKNIK